MTEKLTEEEHNAGVRWMPGKPIGFHKVSYPDCHAPSEKVKQLLDNVREQFAKAKEKTQENVSNANPFSVNKLPRSPSVRKRPT